MAQLTKPELDAMLAKLRARYAEYAAKYDAGIFNVQRFNERYMEALRLGMTVDRILQAEVQTFQELVRKAEEKYAPKQAAGPSKADALLEEFAARQAKYPPADFCPRADDETRRLVGFLSALEARHGGLVPRARQLPPGSPEARLAAVLEPRFFSMLERQGNRPPRAVDDLALALARPIAGDREREAAKKEFFKEAGFLCNLLADLWGILADDAPPARQDGLAAALAAVEGALFDFRLREFRLPPPAR